MTNKAYPFSVPWTRKMIFPQIEWGIGTCLGLFTLFIKPFTWYLKFMQKQALI